MQESLAEHKGRDIEGQVDSWVLQQALNSMSVSPQIDILNYLTLALVSCARNAVSYIYRISSSGYFLIEVYSPLLIHAPEIIPT
jgi:hypothetical protein